MGGIIVASIVGTEAQFFDAIIGGGKTIQRGQGQGQGQGQGRGQ